ncbi:hypothetical protein SH580_18275 [Coraliomargarita algicola]|uniref:Alpha-galactosidase n=1 Tax=Coraliomargarita algicola TaxID=3092156 RepID=A0ABZ0RIZ6_9BACT|nr:hypothetical protein [Coraliomargarita sp. J2-16]WPJ95371.1 hypothetical protein SH580_18275 [Coraliomargarita sp. J2-16]
MKKRVSYLAAILSSLSISYSAWAEAPKAKPYLLSNEYIGREFSLADNHLKTSQILNHRSGQVIQPTSCDEFQLRISEGTHTTGTDQILTTSDFICLDVQSEDEAGQKSLEFLLKNEAHGLNLKVRYELSQDDFFMRKQIKIISERAITLERIDVEAISTSDAYQPYTMREITTSKSRELKMRGWRPGLGQPLFTTESGTFWGIEFPAADNMVVDQELICGYQYGHELTPNKSYTSYKAVMGASDDPAFNSDAFYEYIETIRVRPLRLQIQYNSWFDFHKAVTGPDFIASVEKVNQELCVERGVSPLDAYVIDDGWQDSPKGADWSQEVWPVNKKFDPAFESSFAAAEKVLSKLGIWLSPQANFGARFAVPSMRKAKMGALKTWMSLANTPYMDKLEDRLVELTNQGFSYFKLDGTFGNLRTREFDIDGAEHGVPVMPQLGTEGLSPDDERLNDNKYNELKIYYLTVGTERLMKTFKSMSEANPEVYIVISNGAYLSPWWLMHVDAVWMINAGDAAGGSGRTEQLVYRDGVYHDIWVKENTHYPMNALFNHEPKKTETGESREEFESYLLMNMSRGTGFIELYLKTQELSESDWDVLAEGLKWAEKAFPTFTRSRMHGGDPKKDEVYGFTAWNSEQGYISIHNPADKAQAYSIVLDRKFGLIPSEQALRSHRRCPKASMGSMLATASETRSRSPCSQEKLESSISIKSIHSKLESAPTSHAQEPSIQIAGSCAEPDGIRIRNLIG